MKMFKLFPFASIDPNLDDKDKNFRNVEIYL